VPAIPEPSRAAVPSGRIRFAAANLVLPDGEVGLEGSGIAGTFYVSTIWKAS